jgi:hypothetical protein
MQEEFMKKAAKQKAAQENAAKQEFNVQLHEAQDKELDRQLEGTFPASDPLKIIRGTPSVKVSKSPPRRKSK